MFNIFKRKKAEEDSEFIPKIEENKSDDFNFWLTEEIDLCTAHGYDIKKYITKKTHPLHAKQITKALFDELPEDKIKKLADVEYKDDVKLVAMRKELELDPGKDYFLKNFKPDIIKEDIGANNDILKGVILGDIIGSKYEFSEHEPITNLFHRYSHFTDDTILSIATKEAILENPANPDFNRWYRQFYKKYPRGGYGSGFINWCLNEDNKAYGSWGNGSAMRVSFVASYYNNIEDVISKAYESAIVSHNHIEGVKGAVVTAVCVWMCKNKYSKDEIKEYLFKHYGYTTEKLENRTYGKMHYNLQEVEKNNFRRDTGISCMFTVPYAISCFIESSSFEDCFFKVLENFCDADTVCAVAGGLAGAYYGVDEKYDDILKEKLSIELFTLLGK